MRYVCILFKSGAFRQVRCSNDTAKHARLPRLLDPELCPELFDRIEETTRFVRLLGQAVSDDEVVEIALGGHFATCHRAQHQHIESIPWELLPKHLSAALHVCFGKRPLLPDIGKVKSEVVARLPDEGVQCRHRYLFHRNALLILFQHMNGFLL